MGLIGHIRYSFNIKVFDIYFDQTIATKGSDLLDLLNNFHKYKRNIKVSKYLTIYNDIKITSAKPCDSKDFKLIQISDLIAGFLMQSLKDKQKDSTLFKLVYKYFSDRNIISKKCTTDVTPGDLGTSDAEGCIRVHQNPDILNSL